MIRQYLKAALQSDYRLTPRDMGELARAYLGLLRQTPACGKEEKRAATAAYVDGLLTNGGPAVDSMKKIIGPEKTARLVRAFMYGLE